MSVTESKLCIPFCLCCVLFAAGCGSGYQSELEERNRILERKAATLMQEINDTREKSLRLEKDLKDTTTELALKEGALLVAKRSLTAAEQENGRSQQAAKEAEARVQAAQKELDSARTVMAAMQAQQAAAQERLRVATELAVTQADKLRVYDKYAKDLEAAWQALNAKQRTSAQNEPPVPPTQAEIDRATRGGVLDDNLNPTVNRPVSRKQFSSTVQGMNFEDLKKFIGPPDDDQGTDPRYLIYNKPVTYLVNPDKPDNSISIELRDGVVRGLSFGK